jgi:hypothetical protein
MLKDRRIEYLRRTAVNEVQPGRARQGQHPGAQEEAAKYLKKTYERKKFVDSDQ